MRAKKIILTLIFAVLCDFSAFAAPPINAFDPVENFTTAATTRPPETTTESIISIVSETQPTITATVAPTTEILTTTATPTTTAPPLIPENMREIEENGVKKIVKTYKLSAKENPERISRESIELNGWIYTFSELTKHETTETLTKSYVMNVSFLPDTTDISAIIQVLEKTKSYISADGYSGILTLDENSVIAEVTGTKIVPFTLSETRIFDNLSNNDSSNIPKTLQDKYGRILTLESLTWRINSAFYVDGAEIADSYTATANYLGTGYKNVVTGYAGSADYTGIISKIVPGKTVYNAVFIGEQIPPPTTTPTTTESTTTTTKTTTESTTTTTTEAPTTTEKIVEEEPEKPDYTPIVVTTSSVGGAGLLAGLVFLIFRFKNVKIYNKINGAYAQIGKARANYKVPVINLTPFADKAQSGDFLLEIDRFSARLLNEKMVAINYGDKRFEHNINLNGFKRYEIYVNF